MKIWEVDEGARNVTLRRDTNRYVGFVDNAEEALMSPFAREIKRIIDEEWPEDVITWGRKVSRATVNCSSPEVEDWQCGSYGPDCRTLQEIEESSR